MVSNAQVFRAPAWSQVTTKQKAMGPSPLSSHSPKGSNNGVFTPQPASGQPVWASQPQSPQPAFLAAPLNLNAALDTSCSPGRALFSCHWPINISRGLTPLPVGPFQTYLKCLLSSPHFGTHLCCLCHRGQLGLRQWTGLAGVPEAGGTLIQSSLHPPAWGMANTGQPPRAA